ncbi:MAG: hypothetical protein KAW88_07585 [Candidatus Cloacimonetes bacterium]|nr:hypothetical protein [Candidatus Cloacimonadota bacterium]
MRTKIKLLLYFGMIFIAVNLYATDIGIRIPDTTAVVNDIIDIPVYVDSSLTGESVYSYQLQINFNSSLLSADSASITGTISEPFSMTFNNSVPGQISIAAAGSTALSGTGVLVYIRFTTLLSGGSYISFTGSENNFFNEGTPNMVFDNGYISISALPPPPTIWVNPNSGLLTVGDSLQFTASGGTAPYQWSVTNGTVASIDSLGWLKAISAGFTQVVAEDAMGVIDTTNSFIEIRALKLSITNTNVMQGETFNVPIYTTDITGLNIIAGNFTLSYNANLLEAVDVITTGTLLYGYSEPTFNISAGQIEIAFAESDTLTGQGILLYVQMTASTLYYGGTYISFSDVLFNEDILANTQNGYCYVNQTSPPTLSVTPNTANLIAGDSLQFNVSGGTPPYEWTTSDLTVAYINNSGMLLAIRSGVIIVSVTDFLGATGASGNIQLYDTRVTIPDTTAPVGLIYDLPIYIDELPAGQSVFSIEATISYETPELQAIEVITEGTLTEGWSFAQVVSDNQITFAGASASSFSSEGVMVKIKFQLTDYLSVGENAWVNIHEMLLNEGIPLHWPENGSITGRQAQPDISVSPDSLVDTLATGEIDLQNLRISNTGTDDLTFSITTSEDKYALDFDGNNDYVQIDESANFDLADFTYSVWINVDVFAGGWRTIIDIDNDEQLLGLSGSQYAIYGRCGSHYYGTVTSGLHHLAWSVSGSDYVLYEDGVQIGTGSTCSAGVDADHLMIGSGYGGNEYFDGRIDEVRIWNRGLSQGEIQDNMNQPLTGSETGLVGYWQFNEGSGNTTEDISGNGNIGILVNGPTWVVSTAPPDSPEWLSINPPSGTVSPSGFSDITVTFDATDLVDSTYNANIVISNNDPDEPEVIVPVTLIIKPPAPENVIIYIVSDSVHIEWDEVPGCTYNIYSSIDPYAPKPWTQEAIDIPNTSWSEFISGTKKFYYVKAVN